MSLSEHANLPAVTPEGDNRTPKDGVAWAWVFFAAYALLAIAVLSKGLFSESRLVLSPLTSDIAMQFVDWRQFGFDQLKQGHLPLWNPYAYSGTPFLGGWQTGLLYPPDLIYLVLPLSKAINLEIFLHVVWAGFGMAMWARHHKLHPAACFTAGLMVMFGGQYFCHIYGGHLSMIDAMAWIPWLFLAIEQLLDRPGLRPALLFTLALSMEWLAGHPQTLFNALWASALYIMLRAPRVKQFWKSAAIMLVGAILATVIASPQIVAGLADSSESTRQTGVTFSFASSFSLPPENLLTFAAPWLFGSIRDYWGREYPWEMDLFCSITGLFLALFAVFRVTRPYKWTWTVMAASLMLLALGSHTILFSLLYKFVPGFDLFRSPSKFAFDVELFIALLAAVGLNDLIEQPQKNARLAIGTVSLGGATMLTALVLRSPETADLWFSFVRQTIATNDPNIQVPDVLTLVRIEHFQAVASASVALTGTSLCVVGALLACSLRTKIALFALPLMVLGEMVWFASCTTTYFDLADWDVPQLGHLRYIAQHDGRVLQLGPAPGHSMHLGNQLKPAYDSVVFGNLGVRFGVSNLWGYDPTVLSRYSQFMSFTQDYNPNAATEYLYFYWYSPLFRLLRCSDAFILSSDSYIRHDAFPKSLPHAFFTASYDVIPDRTGMFQHLARPAYDALKVVYLERTVGLPQHKTLGTGEASAVQATTDQVDVSADNSAPALLILTDNYSKYWNIVPRPGDSQRGYRILPADYTVMAIPLQPGHHRFAIIYRPKFFDDSVVAAIVVTALFCLLCMLELFFSLRANARTKHTVKLDGLPAPTPPSKSAPH